MWPVRRLIELLGIDHPIIQAPMKGSVTPDLAAAVSNAGGLGSLGFGVGYVAEVEAGLAEMRARTNAPFNVNFFMPTSSPPLSTGCGIGLRRSIGKRGQVRCPN